LNNLSPFIGDLSQQERQQQQQQQPGEDGCDAVGQGLGRPAAGPLWRQASSHPAPPDFSKLHFLPPPLAE